jgi:membrane-bound metal-dependent hydrolase YbcI (DUF457 family)
MPFAVTHVLIPIILVDLVRDHLFKEHRRMLPNKYILLAGIAGLFPDIDILLRGFIGSLSFITHSFVLPFAFLLLSLIAYKKIEKRKYYKIFAMITIGLTLHILLDIIAHENLGTNIMFLYPLSSKTLGLGFFPFTQFGYIGMAFLDAILLVLWLIHEEIEHKISNFL